MIPDMIYSSQVYSDLRYLTTGPKIFFFLFFIEIVWFELVFVKLLRKITKDAAACVQITWWC